MTRFEPYAPSWECPEKQSSFSLEYNIVYPVAVFDFSLIDKCA